MRALLYQLVKVSHRRYLFESARADMRWRRENAFRPRPPDGHFDEALVVRRDDSLVCRLRSGGAAAVSQRRADHGGGEGRLIDGAGHGAASSCSAISSSFVTLFQFLAVPGVFNVFSRIPDDSFERPMPLGK